MLPNMPEQMFSPWGVSCPVSALSDEARGQRDGGEKLGRIHQMAAVLRHLSQDVVDGELARAALLLLLFLFSSRQTPPLPSAPLSAPLCSSRGVGASLHSEAQTCQSADKVAPRPCPRAPAGTYGADTPASPLPHRDVPGRAGLRPRSAAPWWRVRFGGPAVVPRSFLKLRGGGTCSSRSPSLSAGTQRRLNAAEQLRELCIPPVILCRPLPPPVPGPRREILGEEFPLK